MSATCLCDVCGDAYSIDVMHEVGDEWFCEDCYADYADYLNELQEEEEAAYNEAIEEGLVDWTSID